MVGRISKWENEDKNIFASSKGGGPKYCLSLN